MSLQGLLINTVTIKSTTYAADSEGGRTQTATTVGSYSASVQPARPSDAMVQGREGEIATHMVYFGSDPSVYEGYLIVWGSRTFKVLARAQDQAGRGVVYAVPCREVV